MLVSALVSLSAKDMSKIDYFGMQPPGFKPVVFAPGIISTEDANELDCSFTPDGNQVFFTVETDTSSTIYTIKKMDGKWGKREVAFFSGKYWDVDPYITSDGKILYFSSTRPLTKDGEEKDSDIWFCKMEDNGKWGEPENLGKVNAEGKHDFYTSISKKGTMYTSVFAKGFTGGDLFYATNEEGNYIKSQKLPEPINTEYNEHDPFIAPDESYLIFTSTRPGGYGKADLYITFRKKDGTWDEPINMGEKINSPEYDFCPILSPDGKYFFYTSKASGNGNIYWVDASILESYRKKEN